jgi:hypothetical protein
MSTPQTPLYRSTGTLPRGASADGQDARAHFSEASATPPVDYELRRRFLGNRRRIARSHVLAGTAARRRALEDLAVLGPTGELAEVEAPVPGGVGYGMFYAGQFKEDFAQGTALYWEIVCPASAGGSVADYLYITATNRSALGVEALIAYHAQEPAQFIVFDWALVRQQKDPWALNIAFNDLQRYLHRTSAHGAEFAVLPLRNMTLEVGPTTWVNQVALLNSQTDAWDMSYQFQYMAMPLDQHGAWPGSWGPIVETFEPRYHGTNPMGALNTQLANSVNGGWDQWTSLSAMSAQLRADDKGLLPVFLDPNASWVVTS